MKAAAKNPEDASPKHPIAVVAERTGLSQDVLRVWERRYQAVEPSRGPGGHRAYSDADIARLRLLHATTAAGRSISQVARLSTDELSRMAQEDIAGRVERVDVRRTRSRIGEAVAPEIIERALGTAATLDAVELEHLLRRAVAQLGVTDFIEDVATPLLRRIGDEWHAGRTTIAREHLISATIHDIVAEAMRSIARGSGAATVLVATPAGERHEIGAALVGAAAATEGWRVVYLGADLPATEIAAAATAAGAQAVAVSSIYVSDRERTVAELRALRTLLPPKVLLMVGGAGAEGIADELAGIGIRVGSSLGDLRNALRDAGPTAAARRGGV